ncbi:hypothetical protein LAZ67_8002615 [Cordylochernes scorpioides]|uniref:Mos1 transposase HTH domain-containing protein n=1 Tax=Cordylochernes scorpioides TaxID=51811 RepID=A0ABY6KRM8_9ARAC|nr:hypothetical protein LAZ67_8002615 [Cordylochernes scorpioides]
MGPVKKYVERELGKKKDIITMEAKREMVEKHERGMRVTEIARFYKKSTSTICTILKKKKELRELDAAKGVRRLSKQRPRFLEEVEKLILPGTETGFQCQCHDGRILENGSDICQGVLDRLRFLPIKKMDQRTCIKYCVKNEIKCADAFRMLTVAYGEATLDRSNVYRWYKMFSGGREDVNDEERAGRPRTSTTDEKINEVEKMILAKRRITVREVAEDLNISIGSCLSIFINDLGMRRVAAKFVQKLLNCDQKQHRMNIANEMLDSVRDDPNLLQRVITGDEAWVYG